MQAIDGTEVMDLGTAMNIVLDMAKDLYKKHGEFCNPATCPKHVTDAFNTVEDFITNNLTE